MGMNMQDEELVKMVNLTLKRREVILFFLIVVINRLKCIVSDIGLDSEKLPYLLVSKWPELILHFYYGK